MSEAETLSSVSEEIGSDVQALCGQFAEMIAASEAEFNQLPVFIRPLARSGFKSKAGQSLQDWARTVETLQKGLKSPASLANELSCLDALFDKLVSYFQGVPADTARFIREPETLQTVEQISRERIALIRKLKSAIHQLAVGSQ